MMKNKQSLHGVFLLDKPIGITSNRALQQVRRLFSAKKAGHTGSLDPLASGVLPVCFGEATKFTRFLLNANKRYIIKGKLGIITDTGDSNGQVLVRQQVPSLSFDEFSKVLLSFKGTLFQTPPMYSAMKHRGQPLYKLARQGVTVKRKLRQFIIYELRLCSFKFDNFELEVYCSKGTYIRTFIEDIGLILGCGGYVTMLRRLEAGPFKITDTITLSQLEILKTELCEFELFKLLLPMDSLVLDCVVLNVSSSAAYYLTKGQQIKIANAPSKGLVRLNQQDNSKFLGIGEILDDGRVAPRRLVSECTLKGKKSA